MHDVAEACVLGVVLTGSPSAPLAFSQLQNEHFAHPIRRKIFAAARRVNDRGWPVDLFSVGKEYESLERSRFPIEAAYDCMEGKPSPEHSEFPWSVLGLRSYCEGVRDGHLLRVMAEVGEDLSRQAEDGAVSADALQEAAAKRLEGLKRQADAEEGSISAGLTESAECLLVEGDKQGFRLGFPALDRVIGTSVFPGTLLLVGARPSMGKSVLGTNIGLRCALRGDSALVCSLEVTKTKLQQNLVLAASGASREQIRENPSLFRDGVDRLEECADTLHVISTEAATGADGSPRQLRPSDLYQYVRKYKASHGLKILIVDYMQLMEPDGKKENRQVEVSSISAALKRLALSEEIVVVALSQLSRQTESRDNNKPRLSDLRESGSLEQDADVVLLLYRESYYAERSGDPRDDTLEVIVAKSRFGDTKFVRLGFDRPAARLFDRDPVHGQGRPAGNAPTKHTGDQEQEREELPF